MSQITQKGATGALALQAGGVFPTSTDANLATLVGTRYDLSDGREVIFVSNGATAIASAGLLCQDAAIVSGHDELVVTAFTAYSTNGNVPASVTVTLGGTALVANQYQGGFLIVEEGIGFGQTLRIASNPAAASSATGVVIVLEDSPNVALTTASVVGLLPPHGANIVVNPTTPTNVPVGVTLYSLPAGQVAAGTTGTASYGFLVSKGVCAVLSDSTAPAVGKAISPSTVTAGAIGIATISTPVIGYTALGAESAEAGPVFLNL